MKLKVRNHGLYMLGIFSYVISLSPFLGVNALRALVLLPIVAYTLPVLEKIQPKFMTMKVGHSDVLLAVIAGLPYVLLWPSPYLLVPGALLAATLLFYYFRNTLWGNVLGTTFIASLSFLWALFAENGFLLPSAYWTLYVFTGAVYVEYKIPHRRLKAWVVRASWLSSVLVLSTLSVNYPILLLTLVEPSIRFLFPGQKLGSMKEIATLGRKGAKRDALFLVILVGLSVLSHMLR
ncbi:MAG: hypothetical protein ASUL_08629 [Candidatus Aramenus sulfurataquae]|uniref:Uncharacterized protein n=1 Tax=Candidatus Aramenus sulfurataquae TaxID=1326980 RepID=W7KHA4_9CREN|nr:MAG: hypothetical protein ASUL_08629 [Candidatus Aramenus sulfurataquae]